MKRLIDFVISALVITLLLPIYLLIGILVFLDLGWPIIYKQRYPGLNEQPFTLYKFRTMKNIKDKDGRLLPPNQRLTKLGRFLKKYSLDDLPEFYNVLIGNMSLVGPRPVLIRSISSKKRVQLKRHSVRPGMTGWCQLHHTQPLTWEEKFLLDLYYIEHQSLWLDFKIVIKTITFIFIKR